MSGFRLGVVYIQGFCSVCILANKFRERANLYHKRTSLLTFRFEIICCMYFLDFELLCLNIECSFMFMNFVTFFKIWDCTHLHVKRGHLLNIYTCHCFFSIYFNYVYLYTSRYCNFMK